MKLSNRKQLLEEADMPLKSLLNEDISGAIKAIQSVQFEDKMANMWSDVRKKFRIQQTKSLNDSYKAELEKYIGKQITPQVINQLRGRHASKADAHRGKTIDSLSFLVRDGVTLGIDFEIVLVVKTQDGKKFGIHITQIEG